MAGFSKTSVHTVEQAVYRARKYRRRRFSANPGARAVFEAPPSVPSRSAETPRASAKGEMGAIVRRLRELAVHRPGEADPLD